MARYSRPGDMPFGRAAWLSFSREGMGVWLLRLENLQDVQNVRDVGDVH